MARIHSSLLALAALSLLSSPGTSAPPTFEEEHAEDLRLLNEAHVDADSANLLALFRSRATAASGQADIAGAIKRLGDEQFPVREKASRELVAAGRIAVPALRAALKDRDAERVRGARECLHAIEQVEGPERLEAAARVLSARNPAGAAAALLAYLPYAEDDQQEYELLQALAGAGYRDGKPEADIVAALGDKDPARRAGAAFVLARKLPPQQHEAVVRLLEDADARVRLSAARALVRAGDKASLPVLIALLGEARLPVAWQAEALLTQAAGAKRPTAILKGSVASRKECRGAWERWWKAESERLDLSRVRWPEEDRGSLLIADLDDGRLLDYGTDYKLRWQVEGPGGPLDVQFLPSGRLLVAENHAGLVSERDRSGKVVWEKNLARKGRPGASLVGSCQRLPDGNTLIATRRQLQEVDAEGDPVWSVKWDGFLWSAHQLRDGRIVAVSMGDDPTTEDGSLASGTDVVLLSSKGKVLSRFALEGAVHPWVRLTVLPNGHLLVPVAKGTKVVELTLNGEKVWECEVPKPAFCAARLANGDTLLTVSYENKVIEVDRNGKVIHELKIEGRPWHVQVVR